MVWSQHVLGHPGILWHLQVKVNIQVLIVVPPPSWSWMAHRCILISITSLSRIPALHLVSAGTNAWVSSPESYVVGYQEARNLFRLRESRSWACGNDWIPWGHEGGVLVAEAPCGFIRKEQSNHTDACLPPYDVLHDFWNIPAKRPLPDKALRPWKYCRIISSIENYYLYKVNLINTGSTGSNTNANNGTPQPYAVIYFTELLVAFFSSQTAHWFITLMALCWLHVVKKQPQLL